MKKIIKAFILTFAFMSAFNAYASVRFAGKDGKRQIVEIEPEFKSSDLDHSHRFSNLDYGLRIEVNSDVSADNIIQPYERKGGKVDKIPIFLSTIEPGEFVKENLSKYIREMGIIMYADQATDRILRVTVVQFNAKEMDANAKTVLRYELLDADGNQLIPSQTVSGTDYSKMAKYDKILGKSCAKAMSAIDWGSIAYQLGDKKKVSTTSKETTSSNVTLPAEPRHAADSPFQKVNGDGDTALEHTIIRWYIVSSPQGADVTWRVISSTPDVKNTNGNYVGNTPYESTESFDIKGLTHNNSGNIQIEVLCEKPGYLPQKKRFNLRQAIDQKEISAKFNLVKEDE